MKHSETVTFRPGDKGEGEGTQAKATTAAIIEYQNQAYPFLYDDLKIWCNAAGELWNPHKEHYLKPHQLPKALLQAYEELWEETGDDYLVEYRGQYYYMLDFIYKERLVPKGGELVCEDSYALAKSNAETIAALDPLKNTIILVSKASCWIGPEHFVSVLISPYESSSNLKKIKEALSLHMYQVPEAMKNTDFMNKIQSAAARKTNIHTKDSRQNCLELVKE